MAELERIAERVPNQWLMRSVNTTVETTQIHLRGSAIVHFACHGTKGGPLKVSEIMRRPEGDHAFNIKKSMTLAFLSACETAKDDKKVSDEAMHLAATLLFAGFRGVVATMW
jgi:CHAT domain-containing protein